MEERKAFIQANNKQILGAYVAKYAIEKYLPEGSPITVEIIKVEDLPQFSAVADKAYTFVPGEQRVFNPDDLQWFTLTRFMPPELMNFQGRSVVIDPDIFALTDITELFDMDLQGKAIACCSKKNAWDSSVMLLDNSQLTHWKIETILNDLLEHTRDYITIMQMHEETNVLEIPRIWNNLDKLTPDTKFLHTTRRLTQPWKTGLPIDFTRNKMPPLFGMIPREPIHKLLGKYPSHYQPHADKNIETFFIDLVKEMLENGAVDTKTIDHEMAQNHIRHDMLELVK